MSKSEIDQLRFIQNQTHGDPSMKALGLLSILLAAPVYDLSLCNLETLDLWDFVYAWYFERLDYALEKIGSLP